MIECISLPLDAAQRLHNALKNEEVHAWCKARTGDQKPLALATSYAGECVLSQSFSAASMRVCQPAPVALKVSTTSGDSRMVVDTLVAAFCGPRELTPSVFCNSNGSTSVAGLNLRISAALSSRTSPSASISGARGFIVSYLSGVGLAKADDTNATSHGGKAQHMKPGIQKAQRHVAHFGVCLAGVLPDQRRTEIELCCPIKAQCAFTDVALVLCWVKFDVHTLIVVTGLLSVLLADGARVLMVGQRGHICGLALDFTDGAGRGTIRSKAKAPVLKNTFSEAVATPTEKRGFVTTNFWDWCVCTVPLFWGVVGVIRKDARTASDVFLTTTLHPMRSKTQTVALVPPEGAKTMTTSPVASRSAAPTTTPTTGNTPRIDPVALHFEAVNACAMQSYYTRKGNHAGAARKAVQALAALRRLAAFERMGTAVQGA